jgi:hypothetical protein
MSSFNGSNGPDPFTHPRGHFLLGALTLAWKAIRLPVLLLMTLLEPVVRILTVVALLGVLASIVLELSGSAPKFPFWGAVAFFVGCAAIPYFYRGVMWLLAR